VGRAPASGQLETSGEVMAHAKLRILADGTQIVDGATAPDGVRLPELALHFTAILRRRDDGLGILECRPYAFPPAT
jgi:hypothetical protein